MKLLKPFELAEYDCTLKLNEGWAVRRVFMSIAAVLRLSRCVFTDIHGQFHKTILLVFRLR